MVVHVYNPSYYKDGLGKAWFEASLGKRKLARSNLNKQTGHAVYSCNPSYTGSTVGRTELAMAKNVSPSPKKKKKKTTAKMG
jgi:hypothetical protein